MHYVSTQFNAKFRSDNREVNCKALSTKYTVCTGYQLLPESALFMYVTGIRNANTKKVICAVVSVSGSS